MKTAECAGGWVQPRHPELFGEGGDNHESRTDGPHRAVRAEPRPTEDRAGSDPGNAPAAERPSCGVLTERGSGSTVPPSWYSAP